MGSTLRVQKTLWCTDEVMSDCAVSRVIVALPAYNEAQSLGRLLESVDAELRYAHVNYSVVVVDDGSTDETPRILEAFVSRLPLHSSRHVGNQGLGVTMRDAFALALQHAGAADVIVTMDADGSHQPGLIPRMVQLIHEGCDVVIASRYRPGARVLGVPYFRRFLSYGASWLMRLSHPTPGVRDYTSGFRAYRVAVLQRAIERYGSKFPESSGFQCMAEILLKLRSMGVIFGEAPMILRYDLKESRSKMRIGRTVAQTFKLLLQRHR